MDINISGTQPLWHEYIWDFITQPLRIFQLPSHFFFTIICQELYDPATVDKIYQGPSHCGHEYIRDPATVDINISGT